MNINQKIDHHNDNEPESLDEFISGLRLQAAQCDFQRTKDKYEANSEFDERLIDQIIAGTIHPEVQKELMVEDKNDPRENYIINPLVQARSVVRYCIQGSSC